ncbi:IS701 family transposase [Mesorhizobium sp. M0293]|uniref:IS701 family transposase n=2 Tax=unclassified Mesorhizobium TaxID=325217 RepID=UPI00333B5F52
MSVASWSGSLLAWEQELTALKARVGRVLPRRELRETGADFLDGLLSGIERKTAWLMAEQSGAERPYRMQSLLGRSHWDADRLRDEVRDYVVEALGNEDGVLIVDETGFVKKGDRSAGVARQYSGTAGRIENSQIGVFLAYASRYGQALVDRRLYLPESWTKDRARCAKASIPETVEFATKPKMARAMVEAALDAGVPCAYVLGDAVYGADSSLRRMLEAREQPYVLAVRGAHFMRRGGDRLFEETSPEELASEFEPDDWVCHAAGEGAKGPRLYDWARIRRPWTSKGGFEHWLLVRRKRSTSGEKAYYLVFAPPGSSLAELAAVAGLRWAIEECFERAKDDLGLDHCEARSWHGWHRHMSLCMAALAFLSKLSADLRRSAWSKPNETSPKEPIAA